MTWSAVETQEAPSMHLFSSSFVSADHFSLYPSPNGSFKYINESKYKDWVKDIHKKIQEGERGFWRSMGESNHNGRGECKLIRRT